MFGLESFDACIRLLRLAKGQLGEILSAVEFLDQDALRLTLEEFFADRKPAVKGGEWDSRVLPLRRPYLFNVVIETAGSSHEHDNDKLARFLEAAMGQGLVADGVVAADSAQAKHLWRLREDASVAITRRGHVFKYDLSFPHPSMYRLVEEMRGRLADKWAGRGVVPVGYGHLGDGNLHLNVSTAGRGQPYLDDLARDIEPFVYEWTLRHGGSVSAEHGVGQAKADWLSRARPGPVVGVMRAMKEALDPRGILNPGKVFPLE